MDDAIELMKEEGESGIVAYAEFIANYKDDERILHCFFEGKDDFKYYHIRIKSHAPNYFVENYVCEGKENVITVCELIKGKPEYARAKTGFFIDTDFDPPIANADIYETTVYSFENFYVNNSTIDELLRTEFHIQDRDDRKKCVQLYEQLLNEFNSAILPLNAWLACYADKRNSGSVNQRLNIDETIKHILCEYLLSTNLELKALDEIDSFEKIEQIFGNLEDVSNADFTSKIGVYRGANQGEVFRGKFLIKFVNDFLMRFQAHVSKKDQKVCSRRYRCSLQFTRKTIVTLLSTHARTPDNLITYIKGIAA